MSPWWSDRIRVGLGSARVDIVRAASGWRPRVLATRSVDYAVAEGQTAWQGVLTALRQGLNDVRADGAKSRQAKSGACSIVVGNQWARYQLVPWQAGLANAQEYHSYAAHQFRAVYGDLTEKWEVACSEPCYGSPTLACAIDKELMIGLRGVIAQSGLQLASVQPFLSSALGRWRRKFPERNYWFALMDHERICLLNTTDGVPRLLRVEPVRDGVVTDFLAMLQRECIAVGQAVGDLPVYFFGPGLNRDALRALQEKRMRVLDSASYLAAVNSDARFAMAMT